MKCTVVFDSDEDRDLSFGLVFIPGPVWVQGAEQLINVHPSHPTFDRGDLLPLLAHIGLPSVGNDGNALCVVHNCGYGSYDDLANLQADLAEAGFKVTTIHLGGMSAYYAYLARRAESVGVAETAAGNIAVLWDQQTGDVLADIGGWMRFGNSPTKESAQAIGVSSAVVVAGPAPSDADTKR
jgi:hypothetical protein